jgi:hypothetical protein
MRPARHHVALLLAASALTLVACGGEEEQSAPPPEPAAARPADFPSVTSKTRQDLVRGLPQGPVFAPSTSVLTVGDNRFGFALFDAAKKQVEASAVALYVSRKDGSDLQGPFPARRESFAVKPPYRSAQAAGDLANGDAFYVSTLPFKAAGNRVLTALARMDGRLVAASGHELPVHASGGPPNIGDKATDTHTLTPSDVGGDLSKLTTRIPPDTQNQVDYADAYGREPIVLLFATPQFCQSRVCGPVVDVAEQVKQVYGDKAAFIHMEIFEDNDPANPVNPQVKAFHLPTEPWLFAIEKDGTVAEVLQGAFGPDALTAAVEKVAE